MTHATIAIRTKKAPRVGPSDSASYWNGRWKSLCDKIQSVRTAFIAVFDTTPRSPNSLAGSGGSNMESTNVAMVRACGSPLHGYCEPRTFLPDSSDPICLAESSPSRSLRTFFSPGMWNEPPLSLEFNMGYDVPLAFHGSNQEIPLEHSASPVSLNVHFTQRARLGQ
jgi:hypothetical protein